MTQRDRESDKMRKKKENKNIRKQNGRHIILLSTKHAVHKHRFVRFNNT